MNNLWQDLRYAGRVLFKNPAFSVIAVVTLGLGIGATTAIYSVVDALLLRPITFKDSDRLVLMWNHYPGLNIAQEWLSSGEYLDIKTQAESFEEIAICVGGSFNLTGGDAPQRIEGARVSSSLFSLLGVAAAKGRVFLPEDDQPGKPLIAIISHHLWAGRFGSDPDLLGKPITLDGRQAIVVGIMSPGFSLSKDVMPTVAGVERVDAILPLTLDEEDFRNHGSDNFNVSARLKPGVTIVQAQAELDTIAGRLQQLYPGNYPANSGFRISVIPLLDQVVGNVRLALLILLGSVAFVLLIACANVANLLLARGAARQREFAIRTAVGAGRRRLIRQLLTESLLLATLGGALGLLIAVWGQDALRALGPDNLPRLAEIGIDNRVVGFAFLISVVSAVIFGLAPALKCSRIDLNEMLKESGRSSTGGSRGRRMRSTLVISEIALSLLLLVGAGLLIRSFLALQKVDPGFSAQNVLSLRVSLTAAAYPTPESRATVYQQVWERLERLPGVESAGGVSVLPLSPGLNWGSIWVEGYNAAPGETDIQADQRVASPNYFQTMRIPLLEGRSFDEYDSRDAQRVAIIDRAFARRFWPDENPIGKRVKRGGPDSDSPWLTVVGVVEQVKQYTLESGPPRVAFYTPHSQQSARDMYVVVRASSSQANLIGSVASEVKAADPDLPVYAIAGMKERLADSLTRRRFSMLLLGLFAALALILALVGIYGVMAYVVRQRTHEIGIRMALGAERRDVLKLIVGQGMSLALAGVMIGVAAAFCLTRLMAGLLYGVSATDGLTFLVIAFLLTCCSLFACWIPARRATRLDPMVALRYE